jgi:hypothetical protein
VSRLRIISCFTFRRPIQAAPHLWLSDGSSLYDHFGDGFTLLITEGDPSATSRLVEAAAKHKMPIKTLTLADARLRDRYCARFALIRPDQHIAWRGDELPTDCNSLIAKVTGTVSKAAAPSSVLVQA